MSPVVRGGRAAERTHWRSALRRQRRPRRPHLETGQRVSLRMSLFSRVLGGWVHFTLARWMCHQPRKRPDSKTDPATHIRASSRKVFFSSLRKPTPRLISQRRAEFSDVPHLKPWKAALYQSVKSSMNIGQYDVHIMNESSEPTRSEFVLAAANG
jgi:hypothetical protein